MKKEVRLSETEGGMSEAEVIDMTLSTLTQQSALRSDW